MMTVLGLSLLFILACFSFVLLVGAPYLPTLSKQAEIALDMIDLQPGERMLELGCGDGKILIAAAKRGWQVTGYELNPILALISWLRTRRYGKLVQVRYGNFFTAKWPPAQAIFAFVLQRHMGQLDRKIERSIDGPLRLVSFAFVVPGKEPVREEAAVRLYLYNQHPQKSTKRTA